MAPQSHDMMGGSVRLTDTGINLGEWYHSVTHKMDEWYDEVTKVYEDEEVTIYADRAQKDAAYWAGKLGYDWRRIEEIFAGAAADRITDYDEVFGDADPVVFCK